jgi:hypothetical protein
VADVARHAPQLRRVCARQDPAYDRRDNPQCSGHPEAGSLSSHEAELRLLQWPHEVVVQPGFGQLDYDARQHTSVLRRVVVVLYPR